MPRGEMYLIMMGSEMMMGIEINFSFRTNLSPFSFSFC